MYVCKEIRFHIESWSDWDSNPQPHVYSASVLTSELPGHTMGCV